MQFAQQFPEFRIVSQVATQLQAEYGKKGFDEKSIRRMMNFATLFPNFQIVAPLARQLSWSHFVEVMPIKDELQREFYLTMAATERWSKRTLQSKIDGMLSKSAPPLPQSPTN